MNIIERLFAKIEDFDSTTGQSLAALCLVIILICVVAAIVIAIITLLFSVSLLVGWVGLAGLIYQAVIRLWKKVNS